MPTFLIPREEFLNPAQTLGFGNLKKIFALQKSLPDLQNTLKIPPKVSSFPTLKNFFTRKNSLQPSNHKALDDCQKVSSFPTPFWGFARKMVFSPVFIRLGTIVQKCQVSRHQFLVKIIGMNLANNEGNIENVHLPVWCS